MRETPHQARVHADLGEQSGDVVLFVRGGDEAVHYRRLTDDVLDAQARIERGVGVLENHLYGQLHRALFIRRHGSHGLAAPQALALIRRVQAHGNAPERGLAAAGLTHQAHHFTGTHGKIDLVHRVHDFFAHAGT